MESPLSDVFDTVRRWTELIQFPFLMVSAVAALNITLVPVVKRLVGLREIPTSHKICIIGLPRAGKTTLITALFELIQKGDAAPTVRLHGGKTINRVNKNISLLNSGNHVGPTAESDIFVFRFSYKKRKFFSFVKETYDIEIADFPGEYSLNLISNQSNEKRKAALSVKSVNNMSNETETDDEDFQFVLFGKEFFSWIASSQEYVFVIDLSYILAAVKPYAAVAEISARVRASWQVIEDAVSERGIGRAKTRTVHIVFTKSDSLLVFDPDPIAAHFEGKIINEEESENLREAIRNNGEIEDLRVKEVVDRQSFEKVESMVLKNFDDLIAFFKSRIDHIDVVFVSMLLSQKTAGRLGVKYLLGKLLP